MLDRLIGQGLVHQPLHFTHTSGTGDIDFTEHAADHIDAHKEEPLSPQRRGKGGTDLTFPFGELCGLRLATDGQIAAEFPR